MAPRSGRRSSHRRRSAVGPVAARTAERSSRLDHLLELRRLRRRQRQLRLAVLQLRPFRLLQQEALQTTAAAAIANGNASVDRPGRPVRVRRAHLLQLRLLWLPLLPRRAPGLLRRA